MSSASSYLAEAINRANLDVIVNTRVTKVVPIGEEGGRPVFRGIEFAQTVDGDYASYRLSRTVLLITLYRAGPYFTCQEGGYPVCWIDQDSAYM